MNGNVRYYMKTIEGRNTLYIPVVAEHELTLFVYHLVQPQALKNLHFQKELLEYLLLLLILEADQDHTPGESNQRFTFTPKCYIKNKTEL